MFPTGFCFKFYVMVQNLIFVANPLPSTCPCFLAHSYLISMNNPTNQYSGMFPPSSHNPTSCAPSNW